MATFKFRLSSVLRLRERIKEEKEWDLRALNEIQRRIEIEIQALEEELRDASRVLGGGEGQFFSALELRLLGEHLHGVANRIRQKSAALKNLDQQLIAKRAELIEAMRDVRSLEQLRDRQQEKFRRGEDLMDQKYTDEVAQRKFASPASRKKIPQ